MKAINFAGAALVLATFGLASCGDETAPAETVDPRTMEGITITEARMVLPAVSGNPAAVYFTATNDSDKEAGIRTVDVGGAKSAMLHNTTDGEMVDVMVAQVPAGGELKFEPGAYHVMAMDLDPTLAAGGTTDVTLHYSNGKKSTFPAEIRAAGDER